MDPARLDGRPTDYLKISREQMAIPQVMSAGYHFVPNRFWSYTVTGFALQWSVFKKFVPIYWSDNPLYKPFAFFAEGDWNPHGSAPGTAWLVPLTPLLLLHLLISEFQIENPPLSFPRNIRKVSLLIHKTQENPKKGVLRKTPCQLHSLKTAYLFTLCMLSKYMQLWSSKNMMGLHQEKKSCHFSCHWAIHLENCIWSHSGYLPCTIMWNIYSNMNLHVYLQLYIQYILHVCINIYIYNWKWWETNLQ